jgi:D-alanine transfer protein
VKSPHLISSLIAVAVLLAGLFVGNTFADFAENQHVHALAPAWFDLKSQGSALQKAAFRQPDLLPVYGASELGFPDPFHANTLFRAYPTGFTIFTVGRIRAEPLIIMEKLAAVGPDLKGKKIVITLSPDFAMVEMSSADGYAYNFSPLHAYELAFSTDLSEDLKHEAAKRMLSYPATLRDEPLLRFALEQLAEGSAGSLALYYAILPIGKIWTQSLRLQDQWTTIHYIESQTDLAAKVPRRKKTLDWSSILANAALTYARRSNDNPFGIENDEWVQQYAGLVDQKKNTLSDKWFLAIMAKSKGWADLDLLLGELKELGAQPLIISAPIHGSYYDYLGVSAGARQTYYEKLRRVVGTYGVPLLDFEDHDEDKSFLIDPLFHLSSVGWAYYDQALDSFFQGSLKVGK